LDILATAPALTKIMADLEVPSPAVFEEWLVEERVYLNSLTKEPLIETLKMEYYLKLVAYYASKYRSI
jgi:hypothetical protein